MLIDLHTHSYPASDDSFTTADELVETAKARGLDGICLTDHDYFWSPEEVSALSRRHDFLVLPGSEINTDGSHVLVFGLDRYVFGMHKPAYLRRLVDGAGGVVLAAHPYRRRYYKEKAHLPEEYQAMVERASADGIFSICDGIEGVNGRATEGETAFSLDLGSCLGMGMTGASDSHRTGHMGNVATRFRTRVCSLEDLIRELKAGRYDPAILDQDRAPVSARSLGLHAGGVA